MIHRCRHTGAARARLCAARWSRRPRTRTPPTSALADGDPMAVRRALPDRDPYPENAVLVLGSNVLFARTGRQREITSERAVAELRAEAAPALLRLLFPAFDPDVQQTVTGGDLDILLGVNRWELHPNDAGVLLRVLLHPESTFRRTVVDRAAQSPRTPLEQAAQPTCKCTVAPPQELRIRTGTGTGIRVSTQPRPVEMWVAGFYVSHCGPFRSSPDTLAPPGNMSPAVGGPTGRHARARVLGGLDYRPPVIPAPGRCLSTEPTAETLGKSGTGRLVTSN